MKVEKGQWAIVRNGKVVHMMGQGYNGLCKICTPESTDHATNTTFNTDHEQEELKASTDGMPKCKRCLARIANRARTPSTLTA